MSNNHRTCTARSGNLLESAGNTFFVACDVQASGSSAIVAAPIGEFSFVHLLEIVLGPIHNAFDEMDSTKNKKQAPERD